MVKYLTIDVETTIGNGGNPFDVYNNLICIGVRTSDGFAAVYDVSARNEVQKMVDAADVLIGFNFKFDLHWLRRWGIDFSGKRVYDPQLVEYFLSYQRNSFPSLNDVAFKYTGERKLTVVEDEYWSVGIDTDKIPKDILYEYCGKDVELTHKAALAQMALIPPYQKNIISLAHQDLLVLEEMETNGLRFNREAARIEEEKAQKEKEALIAKLQGEIAVPDGFNWASTRHLSAVLFGGKISIAEKVPNGVWKSGEKAGQVKFKKVEKEYVFPRRMTPLKGTESSYKGVYSTSDDHLTKLGKTELLLDILRIRAIDKLIGTYLQKLPVMQDTYNWGKEYIHGQYDQTTTATGRLASSRPNQQNFPPEANRLIISRY